MMKKKAALISGGGAWGAFGAGTLTRINNDYNKVVGISTGALMSPFVALKEWEFLKMGYTTINNHDIIDKCWYKPYPISKKGKIRKLPIILSLLLGQTNVSTSKSLRKTIDNYFTEIYYEELKKQNKEVVVGTQNYSEVPSKLHYFSSSDNSYEDFKDWMWCSANFPFFTSLVKKGWKNKNGDFHVGLWSDGGLTDLVGFDQLRDDNYSQIDIIIHKPKYEEKYEGNKINNLVDNITTSIEAMRYDIQFENFEKKIKMLNRRGSDVTVYWLPRRLSKTSVMFDEKLMKEWWQEGFDTAFDENRIQHYPAIKKTRL